MGAFLRALLASSTWRMALRNVARNPRRTAIVLSAVTVGLGGILLTMAVNYGMIFQMVDAAIRTELGHVQVHAKGWEEQPGIEHRIPGARASLGQVPPEVKAWARRVRGEGLVFSPRASVGVRLVGIEPDREAKVTSLAHSLVAGDYLDGQRHRVLLGDRLAHRLKVAVGDKVVVSVQDVHGDMTGEAFRVGGVFRTAFRDLDESAVFLRIDEGQKLFGMGGDVSELVMVSKPPADDHKLQELKRAVESRLGPELDVETWKEIRPVLDHMIDMFERMGWITYVAVFVAMAFGIANVLLMSVFERMREIGIMTAIGMPPGRMVAAILVESLVLTMIGVAAGLALGFGLTEALSGGIDLSAWGEGLEAFGIPSRIVPVLREGDFVVPTVVALGTALLAGLWPAIRAVRTRPAEAVRRI